MSNIFFMRGMSAVETNPGRSRFFFRECAFLVRMCCLYAFLRCTLPVPVILKRFFAFDLVFILGMPEKIEAAKIGGEMGKATGKL